MTTESNTQGTAPTAAELALAKLKNKEAETEQTDEQEFQSYACSRSSTRLITPAGFRITFTDFKYLTQNEDAIAYLDYEIQAGNLIGITKGKVVTTSDLNPMEALRKTVRAELIAELAEEAKNSALGIVKDRGKTAGAPNLNVASTKTVAQ